jgi:integrase
MTAMEIDLPYLSRETNRHGKTVLFVRRNGRRIRLREKRGTPEFAQAYAEAVQRLTGPAPAKTARGREPFPKGSLGWLAAQYFGSDEFKTMDPRSQRIRRGVIESCLQEPHTETDKEPMGFCPVAYLTTRKVKRLRDLKKKAGLPGAANNRRKYLSSMFGWALEHDPPLMTQNPARDVRRVKYATTGFHTWSLDELRKFEERHPVGTKPRLALALLLFLGPRRGDMVTLGPQHLRDGGKAIRFAPRKSRHASLQATDKPVLPELAEVIAATPCGDLAFLVTEYGKPFTAAGFGNWFRARCNEAGLLPCTAHGLRKLGATIAADNGATVHQLMAVFDWKTIAQAQTYTEAANRKRMAGEAMPLIAKGSK